MRVFIPRGKPTLAAQPLTDWLARAEPLGRLMQTASTLAGLEAQVHALLPPGVRDSVAAAGIRQEATQSGAEQTLVLHTAHSAAAARVRQIVPSLLDALQRQGSRITAIRVRVQPEDRRREPWHVEERPRTKVAQMTPNGLDSLNALAESLPASPLRDAIAEMVARHRQG